MPTKIILCIITGHIHARLQYPSVDAARMRRRELLDKPLRDMTTEQKLEVAELLRLGIELGWKD